MKYFFFFTTLLVALLASGKKSLDQASINDITTYYYEVGEVVSAKSKSTNDKLTPRKGETIKFIRLKKEESLAQLKDNKLNTKN